MVVTYSKREHWRPTPPIRGIGGCNIHDRHPASGVSVDNTLYIFTLQPTTDTRNLKGENIVSSLKEAGIIITLRGGKRFSPRREVFLSAKGNTLLRGGKRFCVVRPGGFWLKNPFFLRHSIDGILQFARFFINSRQMYAL